MILLLFLFCSVVLGQNKFVRLVISLLLDTEYEVYHSNVTRANLLFDPFDLGSSSTNVVVSDYVVVPSYANRIIVLEYESGDLYFGPPLTKPINNVTFDRLESSHFYAVVVVGNISSTVRPFILDMGIVSKPLQQGSSVNVTIVNLTQQQVAIDVLRNGSTLVAKSLPFGTVASESIWHGQHSYRVVAASPLVNVSKSFTFNGLRWCTLFVVGNVTLLQQEDFQVTYWRLVTAMTTTRSGNDSFRFTVNGLLVSNRELSIRDIGDWQAVPILTSSSSFPSEVTTSLLWSNGSTLVRWTSSPTFRLDTTQFITAFAFGSLDLRNDVQIVVRLDRFFVSSTALFDGSWNAIVLASIQSPMTMLSINSNGDEFVIVRGLYSVASTTISNMQRVTLPSSHTNATIVLRLDLPSIWLADLYIGSMLRRCAFTIVAFGDTRSPVQLFLLDDRMLFAGNAMFNGCETVMSGTTFITKIGLLITSTTYLANASVVSSPSSTSPSAVIASGLISSDSSLSLSMTKTTSIGNATNDNILSSNSPMVENNASWIIATLGALFGVVLLLASMFASLWLIARKRRNTLPQQSSVPLQSSGTNKTIYTSMPTFSEHQRLQVMQYGSLPDTNQPPSNKTAYTTISFPEQQRQPTNVRYGSLANMNQQPPSASSTHYSEMSISELGDGGGYSSARFANQ